MQEVVYFVQSSVIKAGEDSKNRPNFNTSVWDSLLMCGFISTFWIVIMV